MLLCICSDCVPVFAQHYLFSVSQTLKSRNLFNKFWECLWIKYTESNVVGLWFNTIGWFTPLKLIGIWSILDKSRTSVKLFNKVYQVQIRDNMALWQLPSKVNFYKNNTKPPTLPKICTILPHTSGKHAPKYGGIWYNCAKFVED